MQGIDTRLLARAFHMNLPTTYQQNVPNGFSRYLNRLDAHYAKTNTYPQEALKMSLSELPAQAMDGR